MVDDSDCGGVKIVNSGVAIDNGGGGSCGRYGGDIGGVGWRWVMVVSGGGRQW